MKKHICFLFCCIASFIPILEAKGIQKDIIVTGNLAIGYTVIPNDYLEAESVVVELLGANDELLGRQSGEAGAPMEFEAGTPAHRVRLTYYVLSSNGFIIVENDLPPD